MRIRRRLRFSLLSAMVIVAIAALAFGWVAAERRKRLAALDAELRRQEEKVAWAERMCDRGYISRATLAAERNSLERTRSRIDQLGGRPGATAASPPAARPPVPSPDGSMTLHTHIERRRDDPGAYLCVVLEVRDRSGRVLHEENTRASDRMRWTLSWVSDDRIRLKSSDIGTYYWNRQADGRWTKEGG